jgi:hypothetical protein
LEEEVNKLKASNAHLESKGSRLEAELMTLQREMLLHFERAHGVGAMSLSPESN